MNDEVRVVKGEHISTAKQFNQFGDDPHVLEIAAVDGTKYYGYSSNFDVEDMREVEIGDWIVSDQGGEVEIVSDISFHHHFYVDFIKYGGSK